MTLDIFPTYYQILCPHSNARQEKFLCMSLCECLYSEHIDDYSVVLKCIIGKLITLV